MKMKSAWVTHYKLLKDFHNPSLSLVFSLPGWHLSLKNGLKHIVHMKHVNMCTLKHACHSIITESFFPFSLWSRRWMKPTQLWITLIKSFCFKFATICSFVTKPHETTDRKSFLSRYVRLLWMTMLKRKERTVFHGAEELYRPTNRNTCQNDKSRWMLRKVSLSFALSLFVKRHITFPHGDV